jgi:hypothetical protein
MVKPDRRAARREAARELQAARPRPTALEIDAARLSAFPVAGAWCSPWDNPRHLVTLALARRRPDGDLAVMTAIVDLGCMGVKDASVIAKVPPLLADEGVAKRCGPDAQRENAGVVAAVVAAGAQYAKACGVAERDVQRGLVAFLRGVPAAPITVPLGVDGKPFFMAGPYDDAEQVLTALEERFGPDGFHYVLPM